jgi:predicted nuclease of predicted toxin-antitoxin system
MPRILLDQNLPRGLRDILPDHSVETAYNMGWGRLENGDLLTAAEDAGFAIMITADQNIRYQQNLSGR